MRTVFFRKKVDEIKNYRGAEFLLRSLATKEAIKRAVNLNIIKFYNKVSVPEKGDYVVRCNNRYSLYKKDYYCSRDRVGGNLDLVFVVDKVMLVDDTCGVWSKGNSSGYYLEGIRMATEEEIKQYLEKKEK